MTSQAIAISPAQVNGLARPHTADPLTEVANAINVQLAMCAMQYKITCTRDLCIESKHHVIGPEQQAQLRALFQAAGWKDLEYRKLEPGNADQSFRHYFTITAP